MKLSRCLNIFIGKLYLSVLAKLAVSLFMYIFTHELEALLTLYPRAGILIVVVCRFLTSYDLSYPLQMGNKEPKSNKLSLKVEIQSRKGAALSFYSVFQLVGKPCIFVH